MYLDNVFLQLQYFPRHTVAVLFFSPPRGFVSACRPHLVKTAQSDAPSRPRREATACTDPTGALRSTRSASRPYAAVLPPRPPPPLPASSGRRFFSPPPPTDRLLTLLAFRGDTARPCLAWAARACVILSRPVPLRKLRRAAKVAVPRGRSASNISACAPASPSFLLRELQGSLCCRAPDPSLAEVSVAGLAVGRFSVDCLSSLPRL